MTTAERAQAQSNAVRIMDRWKRAHHGHGGDVINGLLNSSKKNVEQWTCSFCYKQLVVTLNIEGYVDVIEELERDSYFDMRITGRQTLFVVTSATVSVAPSQPTAAPARVRIARGDEDV